MSAASKLRRQSSSLSAVTNMRKGAISTIKKLAEGEMQLGASLMRKDLKTQLYAQVDAIIKLFQKWDTDLDGSVSPDEFSKALRQVEPPIEFRSEDEFKKLWDLIDTDNSGSMSLRELQDALTRAAKPVPRPMNPPGPPTKERVKELQDAYGDGPSEAARETLRLREYLESVDDLDALGEVEIEDAVRALERVEYKAGAVVYRQGDVGEAIFFVDSGECYATIQNVSFDEGERVVHKKHGVGTVAEVTQAPVITRVVFDNGESHRYAQASLYKLKRAESAVQPTARVKEVGQYRPGSEHRSYFGERSLVRTEERALTITCRTDVKLLRLSAATFRELKRRQDHKDDLVRGIELFENFNDEQVGKIADMLRPREFADKDSIIIQGEEGHHFFILESGECEAYIHELGTDTLVAKYEPGDLFGEKSLIENKPRGATVKAVGNCRVWLLSRDAFESKEGLGDLSQLHAEQYLTDPRRLIADFYGKGNSKGPAGTTPRGAATSSSWFVVYRPCSQDSIRKMISQVGVGKGLNIKGKSAKKNKLSGFVPFCQISKNEHKAALEPASSDTRVRIFYQTKAAWETARTALDSALIELQAEKGDKLQIERPEVLACDEKYQPDAYGLDVPERLMREVYIVRPDLSPIVGWETGRESEPAFLDMNLHALTGDSQPSVVLYQFDRKNPLNTAGLLMAYAEVEVKPVVSDFDTFLVGSRGMRYEPTPPEQVELMSWSLDHTAELLANPTNKGWMGRWINVLKEEARKGFHPTLPKYGFGDPTSYDLIGSIVKETLSSGAVRHGAECFNFYFPQELDSEFLVVWGDGLSDPPWKTVKEPELREFLLARARDGFSFPLNPVWPARDAGWSEVLQALQQNEEASANLQSWFPPASGILQRIAQLHAAYPAGFTVQKEEDAPAQPEKSGQRKASKNRRGSTVANDQRKDLMRVSLEPSQKSNPLLSDRFSVAEHPDNDTRDLGHLGVDQVRREVKARYRRIRVAIRSGLMRESQIEAEGEVAQ